MTVSIKNAAELNDPVKSGAKSPGSEKPGQTTRSNPVCLEVNVTVRSLPSEPGVLTQPIREEARTVIVFDNGAVIRSASNLPVGQKMILSNSNGRDVVCQVAGGRSLPSLKGYVEVEFLEQVKDFWNIHPAADPVAAPAAPGAPPAARNQEAPALTQPAAGTTISSPSVSANSVPVAKSVPEVAAKQPEASAGRGPSFDDLAGVIGTTSPAASRNSQPAKEITAVEAKIPAVAASEAGARGSQQNAPIRRPTPVEKSLEDVTAAENREEALSISLPAAGGSRDFTNKGLMAYEQAAASSSAKGTDKRTPLIVGISAVALAAVCGMIYFATHRNSVPVAAENSAVSTRASNSESAASTASSSAQPQADTSSASGPQAKLEADSGAPDSRQAGNALAPAVVSGSASSALHSDALKETRTEMRVEPELANGRDRNSSSGAQAQTSASRRPAIPNLKMSSPSAPSKSNAAGSNESAEPAAEIAAAAPAPAASASLLTSAGRTSKPPVAPPSAPAPPPPAVVAAPKVLREPQLLSSTRPVYPQAAKQSNVQGSVTVALDIDAKGKVTNAKPLSGPLLLQQAAVESVRQWKYSPATMDGQPTAAQKVVTIDFRLN
jgi:protein TonB